MLIIERAMATFFFRKYERHNRGYFGFTLCFALLLFCLLNGLSNMESRKLSIVDFLTTTILCFLSVLEFLIWTVIGAYNSKKYDRFWPSLGGENYSLSQKYQLVENIRTSKQLWPTFLCYFLYNFIALPSFMAVYFGWIKSSVALSLFFIIYTCATSICDGIIEFTIISHHPILKKKFYRILSRLLFCKRPTNQVGCEQSAAAGGRNSPPRNVHGNPLITGSDGEKYFEMLNQNWQ